MTTDTRKVVKVTSHKAHTEYYFQMDGHRLWTTLRTRAAIGLKFDMKARLVVTTISLQEGIKQIEKAETPRLMNVIIKVVSL